MKIWHSDYQLFPRGAASGSGKIQFRKGCLLRVDFGDSLVGYADLCPWSIFGDAPLEVQLSNISNSKYSNLVERSIYFARLDAESRKKSQSLYLDNRLKNQFVIENLSNFDLKRIPILQGQRYTEFKVKMGQDLFVETEMLKSLVESLSSESRVRIDFQNRMSTFSLGKWLKRNLSSFSDHLDYLEDPFSYSPEEWGQVQEEFGVRLALGRFESEKMESFAGLNVLVVRPAKHNVQDLLQKAVGQIDELVFSDYSDFPLGQMFALIEAQRTAKDSPFKVSACGLQHQEMYENFQFQDLIRNDGPYVVPPEGLGIGFDEALERQEWRNLA